MSCSGIGALVFERRKALGLTQTALGRKAGLSQDYISKLENGEIDVPRRGTLLALGEPLGLRLADFYQAAGILVALDASDDGSDRIEAVLSDVMALIEGMPEMIQTLEEVKRENTPETYQRWLAQLARAWLSNLRMARSVLQLRGGE